MLPLAERHKVRAARKAQAMLESQQPLTRGGHNAEDGPFVLGADNDGFDRAGIGVVCTDFAISTNAADVVDTKGQIDPVQGEAATEAETTAKAAIEAQVVDTSNLPPANDSRLPWGGTAKGTPSTMPQDTTKAEAKAQGAAPAPAA